MALIEYAASLSAADAGKPGEERRAALVEAENNLARAFELSGRKLVSVYLQRARIYEKRGEPARAAAELEQYLRESPDAANAGAIRQAIKHLRDLNATPKTSSRP
jgi:regulator of sirC expression with transglutaminase-like and TPR domain